MDRLIHIYNNNNTNNTFILYGAFQKTQAKAKLYNKVQMLSILICPYKVIYLIFFMFKLLN